MLNTIKSRISTCEQQAKFVQDRVTQVDRQFAELCHSFGEFSRRTTKIRDKQNEITKSVMNFAETETINRSLSNGLENFANDIALISDYGDSRAQNIDTKVVSELSHYGLVCKHAKDDLKHIFVARDRENNKKRSLDRLRERNPRNRQQLIQAETELVKASAEVSRSRHNLEEQTNAFERKKLHDIKGILLDFITIEMGYYSKALELLTKAYQDINEIDEEADLKDFQDERGKFDAEYKKIIKGSEQPTSPYSGNDNKRVLFKSTPSLGSITTLFSTNSNNNKSKGSNNRRRSPGIPHKHNSPGIPSPSNRKLSKSLDALDRRTDSDRTSGSNDSGSDIESESMSEPIEISKRFVAPKYKK